jgi:hypothetical protein
VPSEHFLKHVVGLLPRGLVEVLLEAAAAALQVAVAGVLVRGVKKVAAVLATSDYFALFAFDLAPSFAPRVRPIALA